MTVDNWYQDEIIERNARDGEIKKQPTDIRAQEPKSHDDENQEKTHWIPEIPTQIVS